jgi:hypothetical protein
MAFLRAGKAAFPSLDGWLHQGWVEGFTKAGWRAILRLEG